MTEIFLIRHGQASFGEQNYDRLSPTGIAQSERLGDWLAEQDLVFDAVYSGERERQRDTARLALSRGGQADMALLVDPAFNELDADGLLQYAVPRMVLREPSLAAVLIDLKANRDAFRRIFERIVDEWVGGGWESAGIGRWEDFRQRVVSGVQALPARHPGSRRIAVFTSGGPITATMAALEGISPEGLDWGIANTSITRITRAADGSLGMTARREIPHLADRQSLVTHL